MKTIILTLLISAVQLSAQFTLFTPENSDLPTSNIKDMLVDYDNRLWIATDTGLVTFQNNIWTTYNTDNSELSSNIIKDIYLDNSGKFYVLNQDKVFIYENNSFEVLLDNISASTIAVDNNQRVLTNTNNSIVRYESSNADTLVGKLFNRQTIGDIRVDKFNTIYFRRDYEGGLDIINNEDKLLNLDLEHAVNKMNGIEDIAIDSSNNLWLSSNKKVYYYNTNDSTYKKYDKEESEVFSETIIFQKIAVNTNNIPFSVGNFIFPQRAFLIFIYNDKVYSYPIDEYYSDDDFDMSINAMAIDLDNNVWIHITDVGLLKFDPSQTSVKVIPADNYTLYPNPAESQISVDLEGDLLIAHYKIIDTEGRVVLTSLGDFSSTQKIDVHSLPIGAYVIELTTATGEMVHNKFVKR